MIKHNHQTRIALLTAVARAVRLHAQGILTDEQCYHAICAAYLTIGYAK